MNRTCTQRTRPRRLQLLLALGPALVAGRLPASEPPPGYMLVPAFADIAERVDPAVVGVTSTRPLEPAAGWLGGDEAGSDLQQESSGSGFLISPDGEVLTNQHVVADAGRVEVELSDGTRYRARVLGADPVADLALLKLETERELPYIVLGDSASVRVGEWVLAIGNPLLYDHTVTVGVISAKGRRLEDSADISYLQTDAAINIGNSGGPLLNLAGEAIGINTAVSSEGQNIGFAIPAERARALLPALRGEQRRRGYLGVEVESVGRSLARRLEQPQPRGAHVRSVEPGQAAARAGLAPGDVILALDDQPIEGAPQLLERLARLAPGSRVRLELRRSGALRELDVVLGAPPGGQPAVEPVAEGASLQLLRLGLAVSALDADQAARLGEPSAALLVTRVDPNGPAARAGLRPNDLLLELDRQPVSDLESLARRLAQLGDRERVLVYVGRAGQHFFRSISAEPVAEESR